MFRLDVSFSALHCSADDCLDFMCFEALRIIFSCSDKEISSHSDKMSWFEARAACRENGGDLVKVGTKDVRDAVSQASTNGTADRFWAGGTNKKWVWSNGRSTLLTNVLKAKQMVYLCFGYAS